MVKFSLQLFVFQHGASGLFLAKNTLRFSELSYQSYLVAEFELNCIFAIIQELRNLVSSSSLGKFYQRGIILQYLDVCEKIQHTLSDQEAVSFYTTGCWSFFFSLSFFIFQYVFLKMPHEDLQYLLILPLKTLSYSA